MTPKQRFLLLADAEDHRKVSHSEPFSTALDFAMLQLIAELPKARDGAMDDDGLRAAANHYRLEGAERYRAIIETIGDKPMEPKHTIPGQIDHRLK